MYLDEAPFPPEGYHLASTFRYPTILIYIAKSLSILISLGSYELASWGVTGGGVFRGLVSLGGIIFIAIVFFSIDIVRGLIQRGVGRLLGYNISFYILFAAFLEGSFAIAPGQFQSRRDALLIAIAPLSLFITLLLPLLFGLSGMISSAIAFFLMINISGTAWDLYFIWRLLSMPKGTVLYTKHILELLVFEPGTGSFVYGR